MIIDFNTEEPKRIPNFKGGEGEFIAAIHTDELGKIISGRLEPGSTIGLHTHDTSSEMIFIISGTADIICDGVAETATAGCCHYCPKGHSHTMRNYGTEDLVFYAVVPEQ